MADIPSFSPPWPTTVLNKTNHFTTGQYGSPAYASHQDFHTSAAGPSLSTTHGYGSTPGINFNMSQVSNATAPPLAHLCGSPYDTSQYSPQQYSAAVHDTTNGYESIQRTNSVTPLPPTSLAQQIQAIFDLLKRGTNPNDIVKYVETFKSMLYSGNFNDLAIIAVLPSEDLAKMVLNVGEYR